jgi:hypothetical protein
MSLLKRIESAEQLPLTELLAEVEESDAREKASETLLMWAWSGSTFQDELDKAIARYRDKFGQSPKMLYVNPIDATTLPLKEIAAEQGLTLRTAVNVLSGKFELA